MGCDVEAWGAGQRRYLGLLRELIRGERSAYLHRCAALNTAGWDGVEVLIATVFFLAVQRYFPPAAPAPSVTRFIAEVRGDVEAAGLQLDTVTAACLVGAVRTDDRHLLDGLDPHVVVETELLMLWKLLAPLSDGELTAVFDQAYRLAADRTSPAPGDGTSPTGPFPAGSASGSTRSTDTAPPMPRPGRGRGG